MKVRKRSHHLFILFILLSGFLNGFAQDQKFTATVSNANPTAGEQIQVTFEIQGSGKGFQAPSFENFNILMGPSQSSQMQFINGSVSQSLSFTYIIQATREGTFKIGPASIETAGKRVQSNILTLVVGKGGSNSQSGQKGEKNDPGSSLEKNVFLKASVNKTAVYRGEGIVVIYKLYTRLPLLSYSLSKTSSLEGFFSQDIDVPQQPEFKSEMLNGVHYNVAEIKKVVLFPQRSGNLIVDPMKGEVVARVQVKRQQSRNPFDAFFNDPFFNQSVQDVPVQLSSEPLKITVSDFPSGAPASFNGAVGKYTMSATFDKKEANAHDAINLKIKITGKGNLKLVDPPQIDFPPDFEKYDPKVNLHAEASESGVSGAKTFEYLLIPKNAGEYKVTVGSFSFFNPEKKKYEEVEGSLFVLKIAKGEETTATAVSGVSKSDIQFLGKDIRFIKVNAVFTTGQGMYYQSALFYFLLGSPAALFFLLLLFRKRYSELQKNTGLLKSRKANRAARKRLSSAKKHLSEHKTDLFLDEMFKALWGFVSDKLQIPVSSLSRENVTAALEVKKVSSDSIRYFLEATEACEMARFAKSKEASMDSIYNKGIEVITKLGEEIE